MFTLDEPYNIAPGLIARSADLKSLAIMIIDILVHPYRIF